MKARNFLCTLLAVGIYTTRAAMPNANDVAAAAVEAAAAASEAATAAVDTLEGSEPAPRYMKKEHGVYVEYVNGEPTDRGLAEHKGPKMAWGEGVVRSFNRSVIEPGTEHPGKAYAESIKVFDIDYHRQQEFIAAVQVFYDEFVPEKSNDVARIVKMFEGEEAKLFEALEAKYGARPDFDVAMLHYDFSSHKQYAWDDKEHEFWYLQACLDLDRVKALHNRVTQLVNSKSTDDDMEALFKELEAADEISSLHREGMVWALANSNSLMEIIRTTHLNTWKYYQIAVELLTEHQQLCEQLEESEHAQQNTEVQREQKVDK